MNVKLQSQPYNFIIIFFGFGRRTRHVSVYLSLNLSLSIDNQATIKTLLINRPQSAQHLIDEIKHDITRLHSQGNAKGRRCNITNPPKMEISLSWVAGHMISAGNETVDELAKEVAESDSSSSDLLPHFPRRKLPAGLSAIKQ